MICTLLIAPLTACHANPDPAATDPKPVEIDENFDFVAQLKKIAFDPNLFFIESKDRIATADMTFTYTGDDYAWPVWSMALKNGCFAEGGRDPQYLKGGACREEWHIRVVRAPKMRYALTSGKKSPARPRSYGSSLASKVSKAMSTDRTAKFSDIIAAQNIEWMETTLSTCPNARELLNAFSKQNWAEDISSGIEPKSFLHADKVAITYENFGANMTYKGIPNNQNPAEWAVELYKTIEPCLVPAKGTPPWSLGLYPD